MNKILIASNNQNKIREIKQVTDKFPIEIISLKEAGIDKDIDETGKTFKENAFIKANEIYKSIKGNMMVLADDSGLMVDALDGLPGVYSARFAGEHGNDKKNNEKLLHLLKGKPLEERSAKFVCAIVLIVNDKEIINVEGEIKGYIIEKELGYNGFGYDPLFLVPEYNMTFAEMDSKRKNSISHRGRALAKFEKEFKEKISNML